MTKHKHYPNPRTNGNTGTYVKHGCGDSSLAGLLLYGGIVAVCTGIAFLWGKACGENITFKQLCIKNGLINDDNDTDE